LQYIFFRIAISIGAQDLLSDGSLLTLRQASLEEVKQKNSAPLQEKAEQLKGMVEKLVSLNKHVILVIPATGTQRVEVFRHWEEIVLETFQDVAMPHFKILNLPELMYDFILTLKFWKFAWRTLELSYDKVTRPTTIGQWEVKRKQVIEFLNAISY